MDLANNYRQFLSLIYQLPKEDIEKLIFTLQSEILPKKNPEPGAIQKLILQAPTWSASDLKDYQQARVSINKSRIA